MSVGQRFDAMSPKTSEETKWEAVVQLGDDDPTSFFAVEPGEKEEYGEGTEGYRQLLSEYRKKYPA
jgi:hypothetical protein